MLWRIEFAKYINLLMKLMSYSEFHIIIAGLVEVIDGVLILFRPTTFIGSSFFYGYS